LWRHSIYCDYNNNGFATIYILHMWFTMIRLFPFVHIWSIYCDGKLYTPFIFKTLRACLHNIPIIWNRVDSFNKLYWKLNFKLKCFSIQTYGFKHSAWTCNGANFSVEFYCCSMFRLYICNKEFHVFPLSLQQFNRQRKLFLKFFLKLWIHSPCIWFSCSLQHR
jgi:hypothetical protein